MILAWDNPYAGVTQVQQNDVNLVIKDRKIAKVAALMPEEIPNGCQGQRARIFQVRASTSVEVDMPEARTYVGIDVAKTNIDIAVRPTSWVWQTSYDGAGIDELVSRLNSLTPTTVLLKATGGLEVPLEAALVAAALPVVVVNPRQVRDLAKAFGQITKTDASDAQVLAHFAEAVRPPVLPCGTPTTRNSTP